MSIVVRAIYRAFLRESRALRRENISVAVLAPLRLENVAKHYGRGSYVTEPSALTLLSIVFPGIPFESLGLSKRTVLSGDDVLSAVRQLFRASQLPLLGVDTALGTLARWNALRASAPCHTRTTTTRGGGVCVIADVTTVFLDHLPLEANIAASHFPFAYRIRISNAGSAPVSVLGRQWVFTDAHGGCIEVPRGSPGIVGHAPLLEPGQHFEYFSGVQIASPRGVMTGSFQCVTGEENTPFDARVDKTMLYGPSTLPPTHYLGS